MARAEPTVRSDSRRVAEAAPRQRPRSALGREKSWVGGLFTVGQGPRVPGRSFERRSVCLAHQVWPVQSGSCARRSRCRRCCSLCHRRSARASPRAQLQHPDHHGHQAVRSALPRVERTGPLLVEGSPAVTDTTVVREAHGEVMNRYVTDRVTWSLTRTRSAPLARAHVPDGRAAFPITEAARRRGSPGSPPSRTSRVRQGQPRRRRPRGGAGGDLGARLL